MQFNKLIHYAKRIIELGPRASLSVLKNRIHTQKIYAAHKRAALSGRAAHTYKRIAAAHNVHESFPSFLWQLRHASDATFPVGLLRPFADDTNILEKADRFVAQEFDLLGSGSLVFAHSILWHEDFRLRMQSDGATGDFMFDKNQFYRDIMISAGRDGNFVKDIKVPWELSRCYHFSVLGQAYQVTCDKKYVDAFVLQATSWMDENPYLLGANWVCPMEVGIRAINWVCAFYYFKDAPRVTDDFWQRFVCSLYDHLVYLENNWEIYDSRTSNHYLSDLVGYYVLCCFFSPLSGVAKKREWCAQEVLREWDKQVFAEGTDYEGSTAYHGLVTELFFVFSEFYKKHEHCNEKDLSAQLSSMIEFIAWCTPLGADQKISVGDNDSGRVLFYGLPQELVRAASGLAMGRRHFQEFGLSVIRTKKHHITLRHHTYSAMQPSGHFHNDAGSITLAIDGIPVIIDPGSFVYTPSAEWRNHFRSVGVHNTCGFEGVEPASLQEYLFGLSLPENRVEEMGSDKHLKTIHRLYARYGVALSREVRLDETIGQVTIADTWLACAGIEKRTDLVAVWNFTLAPDIEACLCDDGWQLSYKGRLLAVLHCEDELFTLHDAWYSPAYGAKVPTHALRARAALEYGRLMRCFFEQEF